MTEEEVAGAPRRAPRSRVISPWQGLTPRAAFHLQRGFPSHPTLFNGLWRTRRLLWHTQRGAKRPRGIKWRG